MPRHARPVPPFANTAMDGYAVRAADTVDGARSTLRVVGTVQAGMSGQDSPVGPGEAVRIMTGAPVPARRRRRRDGRAHRRRPRRRDRRGRARPSLPATTSAPPATTSSPATGPRGRDGPHPRPPRRARHRRAPRGVGRASAPGRGASPPATSWSTTARPLGPGQIRDSNRLTLPALVAESGFEAVDLGLVRDDEAAIEAALSPGGGDLRRPGHHRRGEHGRLRLREGGARPHRRHAVDAGRDQAGQAVGLRHRPRGDGTACPCSACPATRCRRW